MRCPFTRMSPRVIYSRLIILFRTSLVALKSQFVGPLRTQLILLTLMWHYSWVYSRPTLLLTLVFLFSLVYSRLPDPLVFFLPCQFLILTRFSIFVLSLIFLIVILLSAFCVAITYFLKDRPRFLQLFSYAALLRTFPKDRLSI